MRKHRPLMRPVGSSLLACLMILAVCESGLGQPLYTVQEKPAVWERFESAHHAMGIGFRATVYCKSQQVAAGAFAEAWDKVDQLDGLLSDYRDDSAASLLAKFAPHDKPVSIDPELWSLIQTARDIGERTDGAFDITIGPSSHLWRMAIRRNRLPTEEKIIDAQARTGWDKLELHPDNQIRLLKEGMILDFGGIGQGYAADRIAEIFRTHEIESAIIDASGDVVVFGHPPAPQTGWTVSIPASKPFEAIQLRILSGAVTSSGDLEQSLVIDGKTWSHLVDPRTGRATTHSTLVTVIAPTGTEADALASAFSVLAPERAIEIAEAWDNVEARLVIRDPKSESGFAVHQTSSFKKFVADPSLPGTRQQPTRADDNRPPPRN